MTVVTVAAGRRGGGEAPRGGDVGLKDAAQAPTTCPECGTGNYVASFHAVRVLARQPLGPRTDWDLNVGSLDLRSAGSYVSTVRAWAGSVAKALREVEPTAE